MSLSVEEIVSGWNSVKWPTVEGTITTSSVETEHGITTKDFGFHHQSHPLFVSEPKPLSFELLFENTVLFDEIVDDRLLVAI